MLLARLWLLHSLYRGRSNSIVFQFGIYPRNVFARDCTIFNSCTSHMVVGRNGNCFTESFIVGTSGDSLFKSIATSMLVFATMVSPLAAAAKRLNGP